MLGFVGRDVVSDEFGSSKVADDAVTFAWAIELADHRMENAGAALVRGVSIMFPNVITQIRTMYVFWMRKIKL